MLLASPPPRTTSPDMHRYRQLVKSAEAVLTIEQFKTWIRTHVRRILPHGALACGHGRIHAAGVAMDFVVSVDYPVEHLAAISNRSGGIDTPILRRWLQTRQPQLFDIDTPWPGVSETWLTHFREYELINAAAHAVLDVERCIGTYFSFHRIPQPLGDAHRAILIDIIPVLHATLMRIIANIEHSRKTQVLSSHALSEREAEVARWIGLGKTNPEIASLLGLSENTIKHHVTSILQKTGVANRARLAALIAAQESGEPEDGTKVL